METTLLIWWGVVALFMLVVVWRLVKAVGHHAHGGHKIIGFASEREEFFVPGDPDPAEVDEYDDDDDF